MVERPNFNINGENYININDYVMPEEQEEENDIDERELEIQAEAIEEQRQQIRIIHGPQLRTLGEGSVHFTRIPAISASFYQLKDLLRNPNGIEIEEHDVNEIINYIISSTPVRTSYTAKDVDTLLRKNKKNVEYELFLQLSEKFESEQLKVIQDTIGFSDSTKFRLKRRQSSQILYIAFLLSR